jgi:cytoplasmic iron level regulating protein YaaA (DUF328/UPF0246 family)
MNIAVITCGSSKKPYPCEARVMYEDGRFFKTMRTYVENSYDKYYILSGKYGLLEPNQIIEPYGDVVFFAQKIFKKRGLKPQPEEYKLDWAKMVLNQANFTDNIVNWHINIYYWEYLKSYFTQPNHIFHKFERRLGPNLKKYKL